MIKLSSPAKLNLCLDIIKKDSNGYHQIRTIFHKDYSLADEVKIFETKKTDDLSIAQGQPNPPIQNFPKENNLAFKALKLIKETFGIDKCAHIEITKNIPYSSGLGAAASNAATTLKGLNQLWNLSLTQKQLLEMAEQLGMDLPFFIVGGTALGTNYGEKVTPLPALQGLKFSVSPQSSSDSRKTQSAYSQIDLSLCGQNTDKTTRALAAIKKNQPLGLIENLHNDFSQLYRGLPKGHHLSGAGPSTFSVSI